MIVRVRNKNQKKSFEISGEFETLGDVINAVIGTDNEDIMPRGSRIVDVNNDYTTIDPSDRINNSNEVELWVYSSKIDAGSIN